MQFIKKLVILTGGGARGTLMLEKNGFGVWCKLSVFDLRQAISYKFVLISGDDVFVMKIGESRDQSISFELGEIGLKEIHAAIVSDRVIMYGSNCAAKLPAYVIMKKANEHAAQFKEQENFITFSGRDKKIDDYFKEIAPPLYNDFAIAEKNYYPAYVTVIEENASEQSEQEIKVDIKVEAEQESKEQEEKGQEEVKEKDRASEPSKTEKKENVVETKKVMPHELEQRYLRLIFSAPIKAESEPPKPRRKIEEPSFNNVAAAKEGTLYRPSASAESRADSSRRVTLREYHIGENKAAGRKATYFERSSAQLEKLLSSNERFTAIEKLIPGSKFVKINYDQKRFYVVGVIGRDYICYGVPSTYSEVPPEPLCGYARWLPFNAENPRGEGFWMMYQDGISGETLKS